MKVKVSIYHRTRTIKHVVKYFPSYSQLKTWFWIFELLCAFAPTRPRETKESVKMALSMRQFVDTSKCREILNKAPKIIRKRRVILKGDDQTTPTRIPMRGLPCPSADYLVDGQRPMVSDQYLTRHPPPCRSRPKGWENVIQWPNTNNQSLTCKEKSA